MEQLYPFEYMDQTYPFQVAPLPYPISGLEPYISEKTLEIHHDKLYGKYVENLNNLLAQHPELQNLTLEELVRRAPRLQPAVGVPLSRNAGGVYNHILYFYGMMPQPETRSPEGELARAIERFFGTFDNFRDVFMESAQAVFGSGYTWLVIDKKGLGIINMANQENPLMIGLYPIMCIDVWEHAYFLDYYNMRNDYIISWWDLINWLYIESRFKDYIFHSGRNF